MCCCFLCLFFFICSFDLSHSVFLCLNLKCCLHLWKFYTHGLTAGRHDLLQDIKELQKSFMKLNEMKPDTKGFVFSN